MHLQIGLEGEIPEYESQAWLGITTGETDACHNTLNRLAEHLFPIGSSKFPWSVSWKFDSTRQCGSPSWNCHSAARIWASKINSESHFLWAHVRTNLVKLLIPLVICIDIHFVLRFSPEMVLLLLFPLTNHGKLTSYRPWVTCIDGTNSNVLNHLRVGNLWKIVNQGLAFATIKGAPLDPSVKWPREHGAGPFRCMYLLKEQLTTTRVTMTVKAMLMMD